MSPGLHSERVYGIMMRQEQQYKAGGIPIPFLFLSLSLSFFVTRVSAGARARVADRCIAVVVAVGPRRRPRCLC